MGKISNFFKNIYKKLATGFAKIYTKFENLMFWKDKKSEELEKRKKDMQNFEGNIPDDWDLDPKQRKLKRIKELMNKYYTIINNSRKTRRTREEFKEFREKYSKFLNFQFPYSNESFKFHAFEMWGVWIPDDVGFRKICRTGVKMEDYVTWEEREEIWARMLREGKFGHYFYENIAFGATKALKGLYNLFQTPDKRKDLSGFESWSPILTPAEYDLIFEDTFDHEDPKILNIKERDVILPQKEEQKNNETRTTRNK